MLLMPLGPTYSLLVQNDPLHETKIVPDLAERWEVSPDGKTYTFYLRKGVNFHNGTPLTAADVKFSFERMVWPPKDIRSPRQSYYQALDRIELVDDYTIRMITKYPQASFLQMVAEPRAFIYSKSFVEAKGDMKKDDMGSGPFKFKEYMRGVSFKVVRNPDYFLKDRPYLDGIDRYIISDFAAVHAAFKAGKLDILVGYQQGMSPAERKALKERYPEVSIQEVVSPTARTMLLNVTRPPFNDVRARRAVSLALTREPFPIVVAQGDAMLGGYLPPGSFAMPLAELFQRPGYRQAKDQDLAEAKKLLAQAGYEPLKFNIIARDIPDYVGPALLVKDQLRRIGAEVKVEVLEDAAFFQREYAGDFDADSGGLAVAILDPDFYLPYGYATESPYNKGRYSNSKVDQLIKEQSQAMDLSQRVKLTKQIEEVLMEDVPTLPFFWKMYSTLFWPQVKNYQFFGLYLGAKMQDVWMAR